MRITKKIMPGMKGSKKLVETYGENLVCVRYREDRKRNLRLKTIELVIDKSPLLTNASRIPANKIMYLQIKYGEVQLAKAVKSAGGRWNKEKRVWELPFKEVKALGLENRIVKKQKAGIQQ